MKKLELTVILSAIFVLLFSVRSFAQEDERTCGLGLPHGKVYILKEAVAEKKGLFQSLGFSEPTLKPTFDQEMLEKFDESLSGIEDTLDLYLSDDEHTYDYERLRENILSLVKLETPLIVSSAGTSKTNAVKKGLNYFRIDASDVKTLGHWVTKIDTDEENIYTEVVKGSDHYLFRIQKNLVFKKCELPPVTFNSQNAGTPTADAEHEHEAFDRSSDEGDVVTNNPEIPANYVFDLPLKKELDSITTGFLFGGRLFGTNNIKLKEVFQQNEVKAWPLTKNKAKLLDPDEVPDKVKPKNFYTLKDLNVRWNKHIGIDARVPSGTDVHAISDGKVFAIGYLWCPGYTVAIEHKIEGHKLPVYAMYKHMSSKPVQVIESPNGKIRIKKTDDRLLKGEKVRALKVGDPVEAGQLVAFSGGSGAPMSLRSGTKRGCIQNPHLHFEIRVPKTEQDAETISAIEDENIKKLSQTRLTLLEKNAAAVNPADYIEDLDRACYEQKVIEIENALRIEKYHSELLPQLSAGLCSYRAEKAFVKHFAQLPKIYDVRAASDIPAVFPEALKPAAPEIKPIQKAEAPKSVTAQPSKKPINKKPVRKSLKPVDVVKK